MKIGSKYYLESQTDNGGTKETLTGDGDLTAEKIIQEHKDYDMPLGWFLPNDGYGCGYGQTATQAGDIENLGAFATLAKSMGVETGLWTQSNLWPSDENNPQKGERDIYKEVEAGVTSVKTDVAWVGSGYSMALHGVSVAYDAITSKSTVKPNIVTLDGWAGTQRYAGIWTGDQYGGDWEYIRFHIPTYIGTSLSGQPNIGSDMDGIFGGKNQTINIRDFQWKAFTTYMLDMDGWGSNQKSPWALGEDGTSINRSYLKMKAQLMPYINTISHEATAEGGLPMIRAMMLEEENAYTLGKSTQYQYMWGDSFLIAPIYQSTAADASGNDIRNDIYLPSTSDIWIDYFTGEQYRGGQILNNFEVPIWKLPVFVKNGSIIPMYVENNNPNAITSDNPDGLDRSQRVVEFYPAGKTSFTAYEDDGLTLGGGSATTEYTSKVEDDKATLTAKKTSGSYGGMVKERSTEYIVNVSKEPDSVSGNVNGSDVTFTKATSIEDYESATGNVYFYNENPSIFIKDYASTGSSYENTTETVRPKLYIKSTDKVDITNKAFTVTINGFANDQDLGKDELNTSLATPTGLIMQDKTSSEVTIAWDAVAEAVTYDVLVDGNVYRNILDTSYQHLGLNYLTEYTYQVRAVNADGYSDWSGELTVETDDDPYRNVPASTVTWDYGDSWGAIDNAFDFNSGTYFHSTNAVSYNQAMILDLSKSYQLEKFTYQPRMDNKGNGTVKRMDVYTSLDGVNYTKVWDGNANAAWTYTTGNMEIDDIKTMVFPEGTTARYIKLCVIESTGGYFSAAELTPYKIDGTSGVVVGDTNNSGTIEDNDLTFFENYTGLTTVDNDWGYVNALGNFDANDIIDAYDVSFVARMLGTNPVDNSSIATAYKGVEGKIQVIPSKVNVAAGEEITLDVYGFGLQNVNAFSVELPVDNAKYEIINPGSSYIDTIAMRNFSKVRTHSDSSVYNYTLFTNVGTQEMINGTTVLGKITIKAKEDMVWDVEATRAIVVGRDLTKKDAMVDPSETPTIPATEKELKPSDGISSISYYNEVIDQAVTADQIWQPGYAEDKLFDGSETAVGGNAEFKWSTASATWGDEIYLPTQMIFELEEAKTIKRIVVQDRKSTNGRIMKMKVEAYYEGNVVHTEQFDSALSTAFTVTLPGDVGLVDKVVITPQASGGTTDPTHISDPSKNTNRMLTIQEISIISDEGVQVDSIAMNENNAKEVYVGKMAEVSAVISPTNATDPFYEITSSDDSIAKVIKIPTTSGYTYIVQGVSEGDVTLTATSMANPSITATQEFTVIDGVDRTSLQAELDKAISVNESLYTPESYVVLKEAISAGQKVLTNATEQSQVDQVLMSLKFAMAGLSEKGSDATKPSSTNLISQDDMSVIYATSQATESPKELLLDGDKSTIWHSNYNGSHTLPQYVIVDLGAEYNLEQVDYLARQTSANGHITKYQLEISTDGESFTPIVYGSFENDGTSLNAPETAKEIKFDEQTARYVKFIATESLGATKNKYASIAEMNFYGTPVNAINATSIRFELDKLDMILGAMDTLSVILEPTNATNTLTFTSSDESVIKVDENGRVFAVGHGEAEITVVVNALTRTPLSATIQVKVTNPTIDNLTDAIDDAISVLDAEKITEDKVDELNENLQDAITAAQALDSSSNESDIIDAFKGLQDALALYDSKADINAMKELVGLDLSLYSSDSHEAFNTAKANAETALTDIIGNIDSISETYAALASAYNSLVPLDATTLNSIIGEANAINLDDYVDGDAKDAFTAALKSAEDALASATTNAEYAAAFNSLKTAMTDLVKVKRATVEQLNELKDGIKALEDALANNEYTDANKKIIEDMLETAKSALNNKDLTQVDAEKILTDLNVVLNTTVKDVYVKPVTPPGGDDNNSGTPTPGTNNGNGTTGTSNSSIQGAGTDTGDTTNMNYFIEILLLAAVTILGIKHIDTKREE